MTALATRLKRAERERGEARSHAANVRARIERIRRHAEYVDQVVRAVEERCMAVDGDVTPTLREITEDELARIWRACDFVIREASE